MMASRNPQDWVNYDEIVKGPHANRVLEMIKRHNIMSDCPYCIDMLTIDEAGRGMCNTCRDKEQKSKVVDLTEATDDDVDEEYIPPVKIPDDPPRKDFDGYNTDDDNELDIPLDDDLWSRLENIDFGTEFVVRQDTENELGGSILGRRKVRPDEDRKKDIMAMHNKKRREKDKDINKNALYGIINVDEEMRDFIAGVDTLNEIQKATLLHLQDTLIQHVNSFKLRTSPFTK
jgi:hypothetical protein